MEQLKLYVTLSVDEEFFNDNEYSSNIAYVKMCLNDMAEGLMANIDHLEIK